MQDSCVVQEVKRLHAMHYRNRVIGKRSFASLSRCLVMGNFGSIFVMPSADLTAVC